MVKNLKFEIRNRIYTFNKTILNNIICNWKIRKGESRVRKIGKIIDNKFVIDLDSGDRLTKKEIDEIVEFLNKNLYKKEENDLPYIKLINSQNLTKEEWLKQRQRGVGGSDLGAILGLSKWKNIYQLWQEKVFGEKEEDISKQRMFDFGHHFEDLIAKFFEADENKKVKVESFILRNKEYPFMLANIDRWIVGENAGLEIKTTRSFETIRDLKKGIIPNQYLLQCLHYMAVTGAYTWYISVLDMIGLKTYNHKISRSDENVSELIKMAIEKEKDFWNLVENKIEPEINIDGNKETTKRLLNLNFSGEEKIFLNDESDLKLLDSIKMQIKDLEKQEEKIKQEILFKMEGNSKANSENFEIKILETTRNNFDKKKLFELIEISEEIKGKCTKTSISKTLKIKKLQA